MIIPNMKAEEVERELFGELKEVIEFVDSCQARYRKAVLRTTLFPRYFDPVYYTSKKRNKWMILFEARSRKDAGCESRSCHVCVSSTAQGIYAFMPTSTEGILHLNMYPPHFFVRYRDRMKVNKTGLELIAEYFKYNNNYCMAFTHIEKDGIHYQELTATSSQGIALGVSARNNALGVADRGEIMLMKTFISYDMMKGEQVETFLSQDKIRQEIHETIK